MASQFVRDERHLEAPASRPPSRRRAQAFPYHVPGPAGTDFSATLTQQTQAVNGANAASLRNKNRVKSRSGTKSFDSSGWHSLLHEYDIQPYGSAFLESSIASIKNSAFQGSFDRFNLAARVESLQVVGKYPSVTLGDPTGEIVGTILGEVLEDREMRLEVGAVLMLTDVFAIMYSDRDNTGFHINLNSKVHMSIRSTNIKRVFAVNDKLEFDKMPLTNAYIESALEKPNLDQNIFRAQRSKVLAEVRKPVRTVLAEYENDDRYGNDYDNFNNRARGRGGAGYYNPSSRGRGGAYRGGQNNNFSPYGRGRGRGRGGGQDYSSYGRGRGRGGGSTPYGRGRGRGGGLDYSSPYGRGQDGGVQHGQFHGRGGYNTPPGSSRGQPPPRRGGLLRTPPPQRQPHEQLNKRPYGNEPVSARPVQRPRPNGPQDSNISAAPRSTATPEKAAASTLSDAQLDALFGEFDMDAAITQATQSAPGPRQIPEERIESSPVTQPTKERPATASRVAPPPSRVPASAKKSALVVIAPPAPGNGRKGVSGMDDAALSELLGGLDGTEFD